MLLRQEKTLDEDMPIKRPVCPTCDVSMWLTKLLPHASGDRLHDRYCFECKVCDSAAIMPSLND